MGVTHKLLRRDSIEKIELKLKEKYKASLFDFSYLLAIALTDNFLPQSLLGLKKKDLDRIIRILENTKKKLFEYQFLENLIQQIDSTIQYFSRHSKYLYRNAGRHTTEKKKLLLLWDQLLKIEKMRSVHVPLVKEKNGKLEINRDKKTKITRSVEEIDWNDYCTLIIWFNDRIKDCIYSPLVQPKSDRKEEKKSAKSLLEKGYTDLERRANEIVISYRISQEYFGDEKKNIPIKSSIAKGISYKLYPIFQVNFQLDSIDIQEFALDGFVQKKVRFINKRKIPSLEEVIEEKPEIPFPTVIFPNGENLTVTNYTPPFYPSSDLIDEYLEGMIEEIKEENK